MYSALDVARYINGPVFLRYIENIRFLVVHIFRVEI